MDCKIKYNGVLYDTQSFNELILKEIVDKGLYGNNASFTINSAIFSEKAPLEELSLKEEIIKDRFKKRSNDDSSNNEFSAVKNSIGITKVISLCGNIEDIRTPIVKNSFEKEKYFEKFINECKTKWNKISNNELIDKDTIDPTKPEGENKIKKIMDNFFTVSSENGTDIHEIIEAVIKSWDSKKGIDDELIEQNLKKIVFKSIGYPIKNINYTDAIKNPEMKKLIDKVVFIGKQIVEQISKIKDIEKIDLEYKIISKENGVNSELLNFIRTTGDSYKDCDSINGRIDIIAFDKNGNGYIFDIKTSESVPKIKNSENSEKLWSDVKTKSTVAQLKLEERILEQYSIKTISKYIIPVKLSYEFKNNIYNLKEDPKLIDVNLLEDHILIPVDSSDYPDVNNSVNMILPISRSIDLEEISKVDAIMSKLFEKISWEDQNVRNNDKKIEEYKNKVRTVLENDGRTSYQFYTNLLLTSYKGLVPNKLVKAYSKEELNEKLKLYEEGIQENYKNELESLNTKIINSIENKNPELLMNLQSDRYSEHFFSKFKKYLNDGWSLLKNDMYNINGIYFFTKGNRMEIVQLTPKNLTYLHILEKGTSILGRWKKDKDVDTRIVYQSFYGNILLIKMAVLIANNPNLVPKNVKITQVRILNPIHGTEFSATKNELTENYNLLCDNYQIYNNVSLKRLSLDDEFSKFWNTSIAYTDIASDAISSPEITINNKGKIDLRNQDIDDSIKKIEDLMKKLENENPGLKNRSNYDRINPTVLEVYGNLGKSLLWLKGKLSVKIETPKGTYKDKYFSPGTFITPLADSVSSNIREFSSLLDFYRNFATSYYTKLSYEWQELLLKVYEEEKHNKFVGGERWTIFNNWIRKSEDGEIDKRFLIKDFRDPYWKDKPAAKKAAKFMLDVFFEFRYGDLNEFNKEIKRNDVEKCYYYQIPIVEASLVNQLISKVNKQDNDFIERVKNIRKIFEQKAKEVGNVYTDFFAGTQDNFESAIPIDETRLPNKYLDLSDEDRQNLIDTNGIGFAEKDIDIIFGLVTASAARSEAMKKYHLLFSAFFVNLHLLNNNIRIADKSNENMKTIIDALDKFYTNRVLHLPIMDKSLLSTYKIVSVIKSVVSTFSIAFNPQILIRELGQSGYRMFSRSAVGALAIDAKTYANNVKWIIDSCYKNFNTFSLINQVSRRFSIANYGLDEMGQANRLSFWGIGNLSKDVGFEVTKMGDFLYRNAYLWSLLDKDGCKDAYVKTFIDPDFPNGLVIYDMSKDKRFSTAIIKDNKVTWNINDPKWEDQQFVYKSLIEQFIIEGREIKDPITKEWRLIKKGDVLPDAYTLKTISSIRNEVDLMLGHFDNETKSLIFNTFLGGVMLQYKTYLSSLFEQAFSVGHKINVYRMKSHKDLNNKQLYKVYSTTKEEIEKYGAYRLFSEGDPELTKILESEKDIPLEERKSEKWINEEALTLEGTVTKFFELSKALMTASQEDIDEIWKDPKARGTLALFLLDNFGMMLLAGFFDLIFGKKDANEWREAAWFKRWSYSVLWGMTQDGPALSILNGLVGGFNPPAVDTIKRMVGDFGSVIAGDTNTLYAIFHSIGATRELSRILRLW